jgi:hypothetical protein
VMGGGKCTQLHIGILSLMMFWFDNIMLVLVGCTLTKTPVFFLQFVFSTFISNSLSHGSLLSLIWREICLEHQFAIKSQYQIDIISAKYCDIVP